jgi:hypothetical protein
MVQHQPGQWVKARVEQRWRYQGRCRLALYYYVGIGMQYYRVYDSDQCRPVSAAEPDDNDQRDAAAGQEQPERHHETARLLAAVTRVHERRD